MQIPVIALHASAVQTPKGALLFMGHAGAGKSTIAHLLAGRFPVLSDDAVYLAHQSGKFLVTNADRRAFDEFILPSPPSEDLSGSGTNSEWVQLLAVIRIFQAPSIRLVQISDISTCRHLADAAFEIVWQQRGVEQVRQIFSTVAQIARTCPGWELSFTKAIETIELVAAHFS
ncbi:MAG: hypothetical protein JXA42_09425 [Anaerolineales bacterium]|nr:hypothetical protein [Anaerolineales bacterium]